MAAHPGPPARPQVAPGAADPGTEPAVPRTGPLPVERVPEGPGAGRWTPSAPWVHGDPWAGRQGSAPISPPTAGRGAPVWGSDPIPPHAWQHGFGPWSAPPSGPAAPAGPLSTTGPHPPPTLSWGLPSPEPAPAPITVVPDPTSPVPAGTLPVGAPPLAYPRSPPTGPYAPPVPSVRAGAPPDVASPEPTGRNPWMIATGALVVLVALLVASLVVVGGDDGDAAERQPRELPPTTPAPTDELPGGDGPGGDEPGGAEPEPAPTEDLSEIIDEIQGFVEVERGLPFLSDVEVELEDDAAFEARLLEDFDESSADLELLGDAYVALGLVEPGLDLVEAYRELLGVGVVGFYDPETEELVVRGAEPTPYVRTVIAHELVHALDDQHFDLDRDFEAATDESSFGFTAVVEGNASRIEDAYRATFSAAEEAEATAEELSIGLGLDPFAIPLVLLTGLAAPYELGPVLVDEILAAGGDDALAGALTTPPTTSEQVLDPSRYVAGEVGVPVSPPAADGPITEEGAFGAFTLRQLLDGLGVDPGTADDAVEGWGGDAYVQWDDPGGRTCVRLAVVGDTPSDTDELALALQAAADGVPTGSEASLVQPPDEAPVTYTTCG